MATKSMTTKTDAVDLRIEASPEKRFFISMLVKDIELLPAIIDFVDNSVDGARSLRPEGDFKGLHVRLTLDSTKLVIEDNSGGISSDVARHYAFRFGRPVGFKGVEASVGQFGVGMKRALFKLGGAFEVESSAERSRFKMAVDVDTWAAEVGADWSFAFDTIEEGIKVDANKRGTTIVVTKLHQQVGEDFANETTTARLVSMISLQHQSAISGGLEIAVNGYRVKPSVPRLLAGSNVQPINVAFRIPLPTGEIEARIVCGVAAARERDTKDDGRAEDFNEPAEAGWYVFCNDRLVLAADRTGVTGWGVATAAYHPQYRRFRGYVFLYARHSELLPWNTTKTGLDQDSHVFRVVQQRMFTSLTAVLSILNRQKAEVQQREEGDRPLTAALDASTEQDVVDLPKSERFVSPPIPPRPPKTPSNVLNVQYQVNKADMQRAMDAVGLDSARAVGLYSFEYLLRNEVDD